MHCLRSGHAHVRALVIPGEPTPQDWESGIEIIRGNVADPGPVYEAAAGCDTIFHLAAVVGDWGPEDLFQRVTVGGTRNVFDAAVESDCRIVLASSIVVYGDRLGRAVCDEATALGRPYGPYSRSKQTQERLAADLVTAGRCDIRIVRPANVYGPGSRPWVDEIARLLKAGRPTLISGGGQNAGLVYVDNVVDVLLRAASDAAGPGDVFNACDELTVTWARYFGDLARAIRAPRPRSVPGWLAWPLSLASEAGGRAIGLKSRPPLTREAVHLVSADHRIPSQRAREQLGHTMLVDYPEGLAAVERYLRT